MLLEQPDHPRRASANWGRVSGGTETSAATACDSSDTFTCWHLRNFSAHRTNEELSKGTPAGQVAPAKVSAMGHGLREVS